MKIKLLSLAALLICGTFSSVSALQITSQPITQINVSQTSYSEETPFEINGKIWGTAPAGEITRLLYTLKDASGNTLWEFIEPYSKTFTAGEKINADFVIDFSDTLISGDSVLNIELQNASMNGSFAKTLGRGLLPLIFPETTKETIIISEIKSFSATVADTQIENVISFENNGETADYAADIKLFNSQGQEIQNIQSAETSVTAGVVHEFKVNMPLPLDPGLYSIQARIYSNEEAVTGIAIQEISIDGVFAVLSDLQIEPAEFIYSGEEAKINFEGAVSDWDEDVSLNIQVKDKDGADVFSSQEKLEIDPSGRFVGDASFTLPEETAELVVTAEIMAGDEAIGTEKHTTGVFKKMQASPGQSDISFKAEQVKQEFETGSPYRKMSILFLLAIIFSVTGLFIWIAVRHSRAKHLLVALALCGTFSVSHAANVIISTSPADLWVVDTDTTRDFFDQLRFAGIIEIGVSGVFPTYTDITVTTKFLQGTPGTLVGSDTMTFQTESANAYDYTMTVPSTLEDGLYDVVIEFSWPGMTSNPLFSDGEPLINDLGLRIIADNTPPAVNLNYFNASGTNLGVGDFTNNPVRLDVSCADNHGVENAGCQDGTASRFEVLGNFCSTGAAYCLPGAKTYEVCDQVGNCAAPINVEIEYYDPIIPSASSLSISGASGGKLKALAEYTLNIVDMVDPNESAEFPVDDDACGASSPFFNNGGVCKEKLVICGISPSSRGIINESLTGDPTCAIGCPTGFVATEWGTCEEACSRFPFCFMILLK